MDPGSSPGGGTIKYRFNSKMIYKDTMLTFIRSITDNFIDMLSQDPVRPHIPVNHRVGPNRDIFVLRDEQGNPRAITCTSYTSRIPADEHELFESTDSPDVVVFYTIWSYAPGAGRDLIFDAVHHIKTTRPEIKRFVTLSPPTEMARRFHIKNGAVCFRQNPATVNYEYSI